VTSAGVARVTSQTAGRVKARNYLDPVAGRLAVCSLPAVAAAVATEKAEAPA
jgi:hypothetical protein